MKISEAESILKRCGDFETAWIAAGGDELPSIGRWLEEGIAAAAAGAPIPERDDAA